MDDIVEMVAGSWSRVRDGDLQLARGVAGTIVQRLLEGGTETVLLAGTTLDSTEWTDVLSEVYPPPIVLRVLLHVSLGESIRRAQADPGRVATRDPAFVTRMYEAADWRKVAKPDLEVDTDALSAEDVVRCLERAVFSTA